VSLFFIVIIVYATCNNIYELGCTR